MQGERGGVDGAKQGWDAREGAWRGGRGAGERAIFTATPQGQVLGYALGGFEFRKLDA